MIVKAEHGSSQPALLHEFFDRAARQYPERIAVDVPPGVGRPGRQQVTYARLAAESDAVARRILSVVAGECVVAILLPRSSHHLYVAQLAALKAGAAYTCLDSRLPDDHLAYVLEDSGAVVVLTDAAGRERIERAGLPVPKIVDVREIHPGPVEPWSPPPWLTPASLSYVIYTSGTTGRPKGVMIEHGGVANLVASDLEKFELSPDDRVAQGSSSAYDSSVEEIWLAFAAGATLVVMDDDTVRFGPDLVPWLRRERVTVLCPPPTQLRAMGCEDPPTALPDLRLVYVGGEALPQDLADRWSRDLWLENGYGPTECSVTVIRGRIRPGRPVTIGRPVPGNEAWLLDEWLQETTNGEKGELCIGGAGLARGYLNEPELTAKQFVEHPRFGRIYRTGDLACHDGSGELVCLGRIDSQVKVRGYRIELEAVEASLAECAGVREAACRIQEQGSDQLIAAYVVPERPDAPPEFDELREKLGSRLPDYMVPGRFQVLDALPTSVGGKLDRRSLPAIAAPERPADRELTKARDDLEERIAAAFAERLGIEKVSVDDDFFALGGNSLRAAEVVSALRGDVSTERLTVRDVYELRTVARLAAHARGGAVTAGPRDLPRASGNSYPDAVTLLQSAWLLLGLAVGSSLLYVFSFLVFPFLLRLFGLIGLLLLGPVIGMVVVVAYAPLSVLLAVAAKRLLIGRYRELRAPVWSGFYLRNWFVQRLVRMVPWGLLQGTEFQNMALRALGARIGKRVHIHRGVDLLQGGWDLLSIGYDVTVRQDASLRIVTLDDGHVHVRGITIGDGSTVDVRAGVSGGAVMEERAFLGAHSSLAPGARVPRGERWAGIPAQPAGEAPEREPLPANEPTLSPVQHGWAMLLGSLVVGAIMYVPFFVLAIVCVLVLGLDADSFLDWLFQGSSSFGGAVLALTLVCTSLVLGLLLQAQVLRWSRPVPTGNISRWGVDYIRLWLKSGLLESAGNWLSGTVFWPKWLRRAGMKIGPKCEISSIVDVVPEHVTIGDESFFADGIYLASPRVHRGVVTSAATSLGRNTFLGNHAIVPAGQQLPDDVLFGVCTVTDDEQVKPGTSWFGHPPFELPRREVVEADRSLTHDPEPLRYYTRLFWEVSRFLLPAVPLMLMLVWFEVVADAVATWSWPAFVFLALPATTLGMALLSCLLVLAMKWLFLGRVVPGQHVFWSCWCGRWDLLYVAWGRFARPILSTLEGTLLLPWFLRAMGARVGRRVVLGGGFAQVVDPDMLYFEDDVTVEAMFQAHSFEDRVLKIDRVRIRERATVGRASVLLYGADIGERTWVGPQSVVMKHEHLLSERSYQGFPTRLRDGDDGDTDS